MTPPPANATAVAPDYVLRPKRQDPLADGGVEPNRPKPFAARLSLGGRIRHGGSSRAIRLEAHPLQRVESVTLCDLVHQGVPDEDA